MKKNSPLVRSVNIYFGPAIPGVIQKSSVFTGEPSGKLKTTLEEYPILKDLIATTDDYAAMGLTQKGVETLADQVNYLGNTSSEKATKIAEVVGETGSLGQMAGLSGGKVAALAAATTGIDASTASTGIKSLITAMERRR